MLKTVITALTKKLTGGFVLLVMTLVSQKSIAQQFYFPQQAYEDRAVMDKAIPILADQLLTVLNKRPIPDSKEYYDTVFILQLAAGKINETNGSLMKLQKLTDPNETFTMPTVKLVHLEYIISNIMQKNTGKPLNEVVRELLKMHYSAFPPAIWKKLEEQLLVNLNTIILNYRNKVDDLKDKKTDSISYKDASMLCYFYVDVTVFVKFGTIALSAYDELGEENYIIEDSILIPTRDKALVSGVVVKKKGIEGKLPVILSFNIYTGPIDKLNAREMADKGYIGVAINTRGKYLSPQEVEPYEHEANDAYDVIEWISKQSWCNGKIGMYGGSYLGFSTWAAAKKLHPALKTIVPMVSVGPGLDFPKFNGVFSSYMLKWLHRVMNSKTDDMREFTNQKKWDSLYTAWYESGRSFRALDTIEGRPNKIFQRWLRHPAYDNYWKNMIPYKEEFTQIKIPVLTTTGYYDSDQTGALYYFNEHHKYNKLPEHYLVIGPYDHSGAQSFSTGIVDGYAIDSAARIDFNRIVVQWFNYILKDSSKPVVLHGKINFQVMGTNAWRHVSGMNEISNDTLTFYLSNQRVDNHFKLVQKPVPNANNAIRQEVDFTKRISRKKNWQIIDTSFNQYQYLSFVSDPISEPLSINGRYFADLSLVTNKKDLDIEMELFELMPDGKYFLLSTEYVCRASYAKDRAKRQLLQPGKKETIPIRNTFFTSKQLNKGSRLVVLLGVPNRREYQINYGTGKDVSDETIADGKIPLEVKWLSDSWIKIPVYK